MHTAPCVEETLLEEERRAACGLDRHVVTSYHIGGEPEVASANTLIGDPL
jgi:hypothetical protein